MLPRTVLISCVRAFSSTAGRGAAKKGLDVAPKEHSCGIPPWKLPEPPRPEIEELPEALIRPPCMPGMKRGEPCKGFEGMYCVPCRLKYKYPPFSENIDFIPGNVMPPCWWKGQPTCEIDVPDEAKMAAMTLRWECAYD